MTAAASARKGRLRPSTKVFWALLAGVVTFNVGYFAVTREGAPTRTVRALRVYPHDPAAFTQGLVMLDGKLYESTGLYGKSDVREVDLTSGRVVRHTPLPDALFGEGLTGAGDRLLQLTWKEHVGLVYDRGLKLIGTFPIGGEGWGAAYDGRNVIVSDGTASLAFLDKTTLRVVRRVTVRNGGRPVARLNELEAVGENVFANVWGQHRVAIIDKQSGRVKSWLDLAELEAAVRPTDPDDVLNGIAYDPRRDKLYVTGKRWPYLFEIAPR